MINVKVVSVCVTVNRRAIYTRGDDEYTKPNGSI